MVTVVAEHSVDLDLLPEKANILDLGCRGMQFTDYFRALGHNVCAIDADYLERRDEYMQFAVSDTVGRAGIKKSNDPQATTICEGSEIMRVNLKFLLNATGIKQFDLIKIDVEGSEYEIIMSLTEPPAKSLSIEFHLHTGVYKESAIKEMEDKLLSFGYYPVKHDKYPAHGCSPNYWDSLWILK